MRNAHVRRSSFFWWWGMACLLLVLSGCSLIDQFTGADGKTGGPGQPKSGIQLVQHFVDQVPIYGGLAAGLLGMFGTVYNGLRAKKLGTQAAVAQQEADAKGAKLLACIDGVEAVKAEVGDGKYAEAVNDVMREVAGLHGLYADLKAEVNAFRAAKA